MNDNLGMSAPDALIGIRPKKQISARLSERGLTLLKACALEKSIPYQTLLSSIVHLYVEGRLIER